MYRYLLAYTLVLLSCMSGDLEAANLVDNPGFETGDFTGWTQSGNTEFTFVDGLPHSGSFAASFGPTDTLGYISQSLATVPGEQYELHYWLQHNPFGDGIPNAVQVSWGGSVIVDQTNVGTFLYTESVFSNLVPTGASTELKFGFREDTDLFQLDDVFVQSGATRAIPEPGTVFLFASGLAVYVGSGWRRRKSSVAMR